MLILPLRLKYGIINYLNYYHKITTYNCIELISVIDIDFTKDTIHAFVIPELISKTFVTYICTRFVSCTRAFHSENPYTRTHVQFTAG